VLETIKSSTEISYLFAHGRRFNVPYLTLIVRKNQLPHDHPGRVAFIAGKKQGNAVWRNRAKRRMRALCREIGGPWSGYDVIFLAKTQLNEATYSKVLNTCNEISRKAFGDSRQQTS